MAGTSRRGPPYCGQFSIIFGLASQTRYTLGPVKSLSLWRLAIAMTSFLYKILRYWFLRRDSIPRNQAAIALASFFPTSSGRVRLDRVLPSFSRSLKDWIEGGRRFFVIPSPPQFLALSVRISFATCAECTYRHFNFINGYYNIFQMKNTMIKHLRLTFTKH